MRRRAWLLQRLRADASRDGQFYGGQFAALRAARQRGASAHSRGRSVGAAAAVIFSAIITAAVIAFGVGLVVFRWDTYGEVITQADPVWLAVGVGLLLCGVGLLAAAPVVIRISTAAYRQLFGTDDAREFLN